VGEKDIWDRIVYKKFMKRAENIRDKKWTKK
jgi:hypothetical protein